MICSEETGTISLAEGGRLHRDLDRDQLQALLRRLYLQDDVDTTLPLDGVGHVTERGTGTGKHATHTSSHGSHTTGHTSSHVSHNPHTAPHAAAPHAAAPHTTSQTPSKGGTP